MKRVLRVLYLGDIMGKPGRQTVAALLPGLRKKYRADLVLAQAENVSHGKSMSTAHMKELQAAGVDVFTGGNHTTERPSIIPLLEDPAQPVLAPLNQAGVQPSWGVKVIQTDAGPLQVISLLGTVFPVLDAPTANPLRAIDEVLSITQHDHFIGRIVNFHGDWSSEKRIIGYHLDGRVSAVIGDHWHVPTHDAMVLPKGTAHISDVGMCGTLHSSLGVELDGLIERWRDGVDNRNVMSETGPFQLNAVAIEINPTTGLSRKIEQIQVFIS